MDDVKLTTVLRQFLSFHEAGYVSAMLCDENYSADDIVEYIQWCSKRYNDELPTDFGEWLEDRKPRVRIKFLVSEDGHPVSDELEFPKRGEDMDHGSEYEWYYSLREVTDEIMALPVGGSMNFKIRDDVNSHGVVIRLA